MYIILGKPLVPMFNQTAAPNPSLYRIQELPPDFLQGSSLREGVMSFLCTLCAQHLVGCQLMAST